MKEILVYHPRLLGDIISGSTAAEHLKNKYQDSFLTFVTGCKSLIETNPYIDSVVERKIPRRYEQTCFNWIRKRYDLSCFLSEYFFEKQS